jgi:hypothetical protein
MIEKHYARWLNPLLANINAGPLRKFGTEDAKDNSGSEEKVAKATKPETAPDAPKPKKSSKKALEPVAQ